MNRNGNYREAYLRLQCEWLEVNTVEEKVGSSFDVKCILFSASKA